MSGWHESHSSQEFLGAVKDLERERTRLAVSTGVTFVYWLLVGVTAWMIADSISLSITPVVATAVIMGTIYFATAVPAAPAAIGTFEFAVVYVLSCLESVERRDSDSRSSPTPCSSCLQRLWPQSSCHGRESCLLGDYSRHSRA